MSFINGSVLLEFPDLSNREIAHILRKHYQQEDISNNRLVEILKEDAQRNFTNKPEIICGIIRKHLKLPENPLLKLYPESDIDNEINKRIKYMVTKRNPRSSSITEIRVRKEVLRIALGFSKKLTNRNDVGAEIYARCKLTGLSIEETERRLYCAYFKLGVKDSEV